MDATRADWLEGAVAPLDVVRQKVLLAAVRSPWLATVLRRREMRIPIVASAGVTLCLTLASIAPGLLLVLGPALLGVLHVAGDVRYLALRPGYPRRWLVSMGAISAALIVVRIVELVLPGVLPLARIEVGVGWAWAMAGVWMGASSSGDAGQSRRAGLVTVPLGALALLAVSHPAQGRALFAYGHNVMALVIWLFLFRRHKAGALIPLALVAVGTAMLVSGALRGLLHPDGPWMMRLIDEARCAAPSLASGTALRWASSFVFLQAVHYSVWLVWIPQEKLRSDATLTFRMSMRAARRDFGTIGVIFILLLALAVVALSLVAVHRTRAVYLSIATFHGYLELACFAFCWGRGEVPRPFSTSLERSRCTT